MKTAHHRRRADQRHRLPPVQGAHRRASKFEEATEIARRQVRSGAQIIDICLANPDRDELAGYGGAFCPRWSTR